MITIDRREEQEVNEHHQVSLPEVLDLPCVIDTLDGGDYAFLDFDNNPVGIERATIKNLLQKLRSGELERQLAKCDELYLTIILLVEGVYSHLGGYLAFYRESSSGIYYRSRVEPNTRYTDIKALEIRLSQIGIEVIETPNFDCSMKVIQTIYRQRTKPEEDHSLFKRIRPIRIPVKLSSNPAVPKLLSLCGRMPEKVAIRLINRFDSIWSIFNTPDEVLLEVEGMGKGLLQNLKKGIGK